jgi:hypothetical protein
MFMPFPALALVLEHWPDWPRTNTNSPSNQFVDTNNMVRPFRLKSREGRGQTQNYQMHINAYDNIRNATSVAPQSLSGSTPATGSTVDTLGYDNAKIHAYGAQASGSPTAASVVVKLQESADGSTNWADALDNTGTVIGFTLSALQTAAAPGAARIEGLGLNRKRYLRLVATPAFTGGTSPAVLAYAELVFGGDAQQLPVTTVTSST